MPPQLFFLPSYERCLKKLGSRQREVAALTVQALQHYFQSGPPRPGEPYVYQGAGRSHRLVFKKLREFIWEAYVEGEVRVITRQEKDSHFLVFVGNHDQVRQFLRKN